MNDSEYKDSEYKDSEYTDYFSDKSKKEALDMIKNILNDDLMDADLDNALNNVANTINYNAPKRKVKVQILNETEALTGIKKDLNLIDSINDIDKVRYIFSNETGSPVLLGYYDCVSDKLTLSKNGVSYMFPVGTEIVYTIIKECNKSYNNEQDCYKAIVNRRQKEAEWQEENKIVLQDGMKRCQQCNSVYPEMEPYFSYIVNKDDKDKGVYLPICRKCELLRVNDEFYLQLMRDSKGRWLRKNTTMSKDEILDYTISELPKYQTKGVIDDNISFFGKIKCIETGEEFASIKEAAHKYRGISRWRMIEALNNPNKVVLRKHWITVD